MTAPAAPTVSVCVITYNHEPYIRQALESVLAQAVDFDLEIVVADDASKDNTQAIVREVASRAPERFNLMLRDKNVGPARNFDELMLAARGEFIAYLEGDDYWTSRFKLARQVELLRQHPECSGSFHDVEIEVVGKESEPKKRYTGHLRSHVVHLEDMLHRNIVPSSSVVFRREGAFPLPAWHSTLKIGDWTLHLLNAARGPYFYIDDAMAVYRWHPTSNWNTRPMSYQLESVLTTYETIDRHFGGKYSRAIGEHAQSFRWAMVNALMAEGREREAVSMLPGLLAESLAESPRAAARESLSLAKSGAKALLHAARARRAPGGAR